MHKLTGLLLVCVLLGATRASIFNYTKIASIFNVKNYIGNETGNDLWHGLIRDCKKRVSFSCIQKNAYTYLDNAFVDCDNITVFDGLVLRKNNLQYQYCKKKSQDDVDDNLIDDNPGDDKKRDNCNTDEQEHRSIDNKGLSPLEEITSALHRKTVKFLATRDYELQLPEFFFEGANLKISPREIDDNGALIRVDFGQKDIANQGRIFKKLRKFIQNKLLMSFLALMLIIKLIKVKFMFVIPFLFGVGTAKKLFLKLLLFFVPAFAHVFKLCSSYYSSTKHHHHHHQIAHHHHHVPVPVPVPAVTPVHHHPPHEEEFDGYDYAHPHLQYRKDIEELREWGIEPNEDPYEEVNQQLGPVYPGPYGGYKQQSVHAHNLAYSGYVNDKLNRRAPVSLVPAVPVEPLPQSPSVNIVGISGVRPSPGLPYVPPVVKGPVIALKNQPTITRVVSKSKMSRQAFDDDFYSPILQRLDDIFTQMGVFDEACKVWLVCRVYRNHESYAPHGNMISVELSKDVENLPIRDPPTESSQRFHLYFNAARLGTDRGDCDKAYSCANKI